MPVLLDTGAQCSIMNLDVFEGGVPGKWEKGPFLGFGFSKSVEGFETEGLFCFYPVPWKPLSPYFVSLPLI